MRRAECKNVYVQLEELFRLYPERITTESLHYNLHGEFKRAYFPSHKGNYFCIEIISCFTLP